MKLKYLLMSSVIFIVFIVSVGFFFLSSQKSRTNQSEQIKLSSDEKTLNTPVTSAENSSWVNDEMNAIEPQATNLNQDVLKLSLTAYQHAQKLGVTHNQFLTIVDYSKPSADRRLWVVDLSNKKVLFNTWVAHGRNSGLNNATSFSNSPSSLKSSIGVFITADVYTGKHGESLRVQGLESGINSNAYNRSIVIHGADYVSESIAKSTGRIGRSWGCPAVSNDVIVPLINTIKNKSLIVAYYPDQNWLKKSSFLT